MAKMKIFELKNYINEQQKGNRPIESKDIQNYLEKSAGVKKTHSSNLEENEIQMVKKHFMSNQNHQKQNTTYQSGSNQGTQGQKNQNQRYHGSNNQNTYGQGNQKTSGQGSNHSNSSQNSQGNQRPADQGNSRPNSGQYGQNNNRSNSGQYSQGNNRPNSGQYGQNNNRPNSGQYSQSNNRPNSGQYSQSNNRPNSGQYNNQNSNRPNSGQYSQGNNRPNSGQYGQNNNRPNSGQYSQNNNRPNSGQYSQSNNRPNSGQYNNQNSNRPNSGQYSQGNSRPNSGQYGQGNQRPAGQGGNRPNSGQYGQGNQRPAGQNQGRPGNQNTGYKNYSRPGGNNQRPSGGYTSYESYRKDEDDKPAYNRPGQGGNKKPSGRGGERKNFDQQILDQKVAEKNDGTNKRNRDRINKSKYHKEREVSNSNDDRDLNDTLIKGKVIKKGQFIKPKQVEVVEEAIKTIVIPEVLTIRELAEKMKMPAAVLVKKLFLAGTVVSINQDITFEEAEEIALEYEIIAEKEVIVNEVEELLKEEDEDPETLVKRPPVVCVMGHVDHGKTSLLDAIREANVTAKEAGGITQHIGAYVVNINGEKIAFLDTPGHEAFTSMRMRGAKSTDIAILVVAADDGVMPQTVEAINHAKAANVEIIVAINKIDKPSANIERVKQELTEHELIPEDWGGDTIFVPVSAHTKEGIDTLLEMIILNSDILELKANPDRNARGIVIEAELDKGRGPVATVLVQKGTLRVGDNVAVGSAYGKVRAMMDHLGRKVEEATPSTPVEILGLNEVPDAGETFMVTDNEKEARNISETYISQGRERLLADTKAKLSLDKLFSQIQAGNIKELNLIIKADVQGSVEAMKQSLQKLSNEEVSVRILHGGVGAINESDVILASTSNAIIIGFNVRPDNAAKERADYENVDIKLYRVIYNAIDDIEAAMKGLLDPVYEEKVIAHAEVRQTFKASGVGTIAGAYVTDGKIQRGSSARIYRDNVLIHEGELASLKRFQDDVKEVATGYECGLVFEKYNDLKEGDSVEFYMMVEVPR